MSHSDHTTRPPATGGVADPAQEIRILDLVAVLIRQWRLIAAIVLVAAVGGVGLYRVWPKRYTASTVLLPSQDAGDTRSQLLLSQLPAGLLGLAGGGNSNQARIGAILKSGTLIDSMVARFGYEKGSDGEREIRTILGKYTSVRAGEGGALVISVGSKDAQTAFDVAREFPSLVNALVIRLGAEAATQRLAFLEGQLATARERLEASEQRLVAFQQAEAAPEVQEQARRTLEAAARLQQQIMEQEIKVAQMRRVATPDNPELRAAVAELNGWRAQLARLTSGSTSTDVFLSLKESPELQLAAARLLREFKKDEQVYLSLSASLVEAQATAKNDLPVVSVLDHPKLPLAPTAYPTTLVVVVAALLGLCAGVVVAFARQYAAGLRHDPENADFFRTCDDFRADLARLLPRRTGAAARRARPS